MPGSRAVDHAVGAHLDDGAVLAVVNTVLNAAWAASGYAVVPDKLGLPPAKYSYLVSQKVSDAGNISILQFLKDNSLSNAVNGQPLDIVPMKFLTGRGASGTDRMVAYSQDQNRVRFPLVPLQRTPVEYRGISQLTYYYGRLGAVEWVYPETAQYADGI
jgi:hypothetical protein